jgi:hypothetical protein
MTTHAMTPDGESTANWAIRKPGFLGSVRQLVECGRCGNGLDPASPSHPRPCIGLMTPTMHFLCRACYDDLPGDGL